MSGRLVTLIVAILALTACFVCWATLPLVWDGASQLCITLIRQEPFVYLTRFHTILLWRPTVWASHFTDNPLILQAIYGFPFIIAPAFSVAVSWWIVRKEFPELIIWAVFGVGAGTLPGQAFIINDSIWQQTLFWPIYLSVFVKLTRPQVIALAMLAVFQLVHQSGVALSVGAAAAAVIVGYYSDESEQPRYRNRAIALGILALLGVAKIVITNHISWLEDTYAEKEFAWWVVKEKWMMAVAGHPLHGLECAWAAAICVFCATLPAARKHRNRLIAATIVLLVVAGGIWIYWAADPHRWYKGLDYRRWILPLTMPFYILAFLEALARSRRWVPLTSPAMDRLQTPRAVAGILLACIFAAVLVLQAAEWRQMLRRLEAEVKQSPQLITPLASVEWLQGTPLDHWGTSDAITLLEGKQPYKLLLTKEAIRDIHLDPPQVPNQYWFLQSRPHPPPPGPRGWVDYAPFLRELNRQEATTRNASTRK